MNALGIGAQGLGGLTTVLDVKIHDYPTHAAAQPVAIIPNCAATRHVHFVLDGTGPASLPVPDPASGPTFSGRPRRPRDASTSTRFTRDDILDWKAGETLLLSGRMLTGRDAAHQRIADLFASGAGLPAGVDFTDRFIYYVGPVDPVREEVVGPAGPTTSTRMDRFTDMMLEKDGTARHDWQGRARSRDHRSIKRHQVGVPDRRRRCGLPRIESHPFVAGRRISGSRDGSNPRVRSENMPVTVAVDSQGTPSTTRGPPSGKGASGTFAGHSAGSRMAGYLLEVTR